MGTVRENAPDICRGTLERTFMPTIDYFLTGDHVAAQERFVAALASQGFSTTANPNGSLRVERGSKTATFWLGAWAGKAKQHLVFEASFFAHEGNLVARIQRNSGGGAMAGAIGVARSNKAFSEVDQAIGQAMVDAGILAHVARA